MDCNNFICTSQDLKTGECDLPQKFCIADACEKYESCSSCANESEKSIIVCQYCRNW